MARQNLLARFEAFIQRAVEGPFAFLFPSRVEPVELVRKLERAMEDNVLLQSEGRRLAPNNYDIYLSIKDYEQLAPSQVMLIRDWQNQLVEFARHRHFTLRTMPIIRIHSDTSLRVGSLRVEAELADRQSGGGSGGESGPMATQALSAEELARLRAQLPQGQQLPGIPAVPGGSSLPNQNNMPMQRSSASNPHMPAVPSGPPEAPRIQMPQAWLTIRLPQAGQQIYRIEKPVINIGRQLSNDIIVEDKRVSRYHAQIKFQPDGLFAIYDLGSTNGITINNVPHMRQHTLRSGDHFTIGSYDFYFERR